MTIAVNLRGRDGKLSMSSREPCGSIDDILRAAHPNRRNFKSPTSGHLKLQTLKDSSTYEYLSGGSK